MNINFLISIIQFIIFISSVDAILENGKENLRDTSSSSSSFSTIHSNKSPTKWAVYLYDKKRDRYLTDEEANMVAEEKNFINLGKIGELEGYWLFKMKEDEYEGENDTNNNENNKNENSDDNDLLSCQENDNECKSQYDEKKKKRNIIRKRTITEAEDDLSYLEDLHWFEKQRYVQRYKREFVAYSINDLLNHGIGGKSNVYDDNIQRRQYINSYKYDQQINGQFVNKRSLYDIFRKNNLNKEKKEARGITFNDKYSDSDISYDFENLNFTDPFFHRQWHLYNNGTVSKHIGNDINVVPLWKRGINGTGVVVSVIDDGVEWTHEDINPNWNVESSFDFSLNSQYTDKRRLSKDDSHGTRCAGAIAAQPNSVCGIGVAFGAKIAGERLISTMTTDSMEATALNYKYQINDIYSNSWGPSDDGTSLEGPGTLCNKALQNGVLKGRKGYGSIFIFASGNGGVYDDNCNFDGFANSIYTIAIGAIAHDNSKPFYAEVCSAQLAVTYSGDRKLAITTTDILNSGVDKVTKVKGCTSDHSGTSAAAPIASGIIALMLSVRSDLGWRDVQHIIVNNAVIVNPDDSGWIKNGAGHFVHHFYGFGKLDAEKLVDASIKHKILPIAPLKYSKEVSSRLTIPIDNTPVESTIELTEKEVGVIHSLEHVQVTVKLPHKNRRYLTIKLISPSGTESLLATERPYDEGTNGFNGWTFMTVFNWGESPIGIWKLVIIDSRRTENPDNIVWKLGKLVSWKITVHGLCDEKHVLYNENKRPYCSVNINNDNSLFETIKNKYVFLGLMLICIIVCSFIFYLFNKKRNDKYLPLQTNEPNFELSKLKNKEFHNSDTIYKSSQASLDIKNKSSPTKSSANSNNTKASPSYSIEVETENNSKNVPLMHFKMNNKSNLVKSWSLSNIQERKSNMYSSNEDNTPIAEDKKFKFPKSGNAQDIRNLIERNTRELQKQSSLRKEFGSTASLKNDTSEKKPMLRRACSSKILLDDGESKNVKKSNLKLNKSKSSNNLKLKF
ncbi:hypothetical protein BCR36DRAFT_408674 [Piromyces finnis]|uniref:P/Homo B domain-containing protein n=1 Tax=Piromyces finnis TaxID=1754191 RepID=A0A1Y1VLZ6_9FUNG|nr:hypothetical protein BCR36DRAFT_408674 [Piromyces finnis]|eukprot:ORX59146.1 hypothetical protein BCR36DRAFT_408674 [Piromyces finnis]